MESLTPRYTSHPSNRLKLECATDASAVVLRVEGEIDLETAPAFDAEIRRIIEAQPERVLIDLAGVEFIDSTGLSALIRADQGATAAGQQLSLRGGSSQVRRLFELTGLLDRLNFEE
jgi:anti-sigma B factor antagonist